MNLFHTIILNEELKRSERNSGRDRQWIYICCPLNKYQCYVNKLKQLDHNLKNNKLAGLLHYVQISLEKKLTDQRRRKSNRPISLHEYFSKQTVHILRWINKIYSWTPLLKGIWTYGPQYQGTPVSLQSTHNKLKYEILKIQIKTHCKQNKKHLLRIFKSIIYYKHSE